MANFRPVRRTQLISPFGVGAIVDFPNDEALMTAGLDAWPSANDQCPPEWKVVEERLQKKLGVSHFRLPPDYRERDGEPAYHRKQIPYVRFPRWHFCPACGLMAERLLYGSGIYECRGKEHASQKKKPRVVPVRFVAVCPKGHIEDFPFMEWVHKGQAIDSSTDHQLRYRSGRSAALSGVVIECSCGARENLGGAFNYNPDTEESALRHRIGYDCKGGQPWLGTSAQTTRHCGEMLKVVQRSASNVYFPQIHSSIYLPLWGERTDGRVIRALEDPAIWEILKDSLDEGKYISPDRCAGVAAGRGLDPEKLREAAQRKLDGIDDKSDSTEDEFRWSEYEAFREARGGEQTDLLIEALDINNYDIRLAPFFKRICLVRKLRETRVLAGFSRLLPPGAEDETVETQPLARSPHIRWLPALVVRGEGIFFEFNKDTIDAWTTSSDVASRIEELGNHFNLARKQRGQITFEISPKLVMIHTFAHLLIRQLSFDCGYGSAALRERIYCDRDKNVEPMQGLLIYTAAGDSEGTLGGLVRKGQPYNLEPSIFSAIREAEWCSSDPVCIESQGQGTDSANLAACHGCALLPETSCEEGNRLLDRASIIGKPKCRNTGFFGKLIT